MPVILANATLAALAPPMVQRADVLVEDGRIAEVGESLSAPAAVVVDCSGRWSCPEMCVLTPTSTRAGERYAGAVSIAPQLPGHSRTDLVAPGSIARRAGNPILSDGWRHGCASLRNHGPGGSPCLAQRHRRPSTSSRTPCRRLGCAVWCVTRSPTVEGWSGAEQAA
jgi:hypothetical protein